VIYGTIYGGFEQGEDAQGENALRRYQLRTTHVRESEFLFVCFVCYLCDVMQCVVCSVCHVIYCTIFRESEQSDDGRVARRELSYEDRMYSWKRKNKTRKGKEKQRVARL